MKLRDADKKNWNITINLREIEKKDFIDLQRKNIQNCEYLITYYTSLCNPGSPLQCAFVNGFNSSDGIVNCMNKKSPVKSSPQIQIDINDVKTFYEVFATATTEQVRLCTYSRS